MNPKLKLQSKLGSQNFLNDFSSKENKHSNVVQKSLQQILYANRNLLTKKSSNTKQCLMSPQPLIGLKTSQVPVDQSRRGKSRLQVESRPGTRQSLEKRNDRTRVVSKATGATPAEELRVTREAKRGSEKAQAIGSGQLRQGHSGGTLAMALPQFPHSQGCSNDLRRQLLGKEALRGGEAPVANQVVSDKLGLSRAQMAQTATLGFKAKPALGVASEAKSPMRLERDGETAVEDYARVPGLCCSFISSISSHLLRKESQQLQPGSHCANDYFDMSARVSLYDELFGMSHSLRLGDRTVFLALQVTEVFLCWNCVARESVRPLGVAALFMAAKYEEIYPPRMAHFTRLVGEDTPATLLPQLETSLLQFLHFDLTRCLPLDFFRIFATVAQFDSPTTAFGLFVMSLCCMDQSFHSCSPSLVSFGICYFLQKVFRLNAFYDQLLADEPMYSLSVIQGGFDNRRMANIGVIDCPSQDCRLEFRCSDVRRVAEGLFAITRQVKRDDCPGLFLRFERDNLASSILSKLRQ